MNYVQRIYYGLNSSDTPTTACSRTERQHTIFRPLGPQSNTLPGVSKGPQACSSERNANPSYWNNQ